MIQLAVELLHCITHRDLFAFSTPGNLRRGPYVMTGSYLLVHAASLVAVAAACDNTWELGVGGSQSLEEKDNSPKGCW